MGEGRGGGVPYQAPVLRSGPLAAAVHIQSQRRQPQPSLVGLYPGEGIERGARRAKQSEAIRREGAMVRGE